MDHVLLGSVEAQIGVLAFYLRDGLCVVQLTHALLGPLGACMLGK